MLTIMVGCAIVPGLPSIARALGVGEAAGWLITLPSLGVVIFGPLAGRFIDRHGARKALCIGLILYAVLGAGTVLLRGAWLVFSSRILLGGVTALVMAGGTALISDFYRGTARIAMIARQGTAIELGGVVFLAIGGVLTKLGWQAPFALYGMALVFLLLILTTVPSVEHAREAEVPSAAEPTGPSLRPVLLAALCSMVVFFSAIIALPSHLSGTGPHSPGLSEAQIGYFLAFVSLVAAAVASGMPKLVRARGEAKTMMIAFASYEVAHLCFALANGFYMDIAGAVLLGVGFGLSVPLVNHMTVEQSDERSRGRNLAHLSMAIFLGQFLASPLEAISGGEQATFLAAALISFGALIAAWRVSVRAQSANDPF
ncbi:hypothetical protein A9762_14945 [Pandoraea sp. ISTKB]|nr:hypothetical protein A9762_14945 [Pandoraea sp. ISTKB]